MKHVLVSGGARGIGFACAKQFALNGYNVSIIGKTQSNLDSAVESLQEIGDNITVNGYCGDVSDPMFVNSLIEKIDVTPIDVLVNTAGAAKKAITTELTHADWNHSMQSKFFTYTNVMDAVLPRMAARKSGSVVNVIGMGGKCQVVNHLNGGAANAALMLATTGLAQAYAKFGIRVNGINPASVETDHIKKFITQDAEWKGIPYEEAKEELVSKFPMGRMVLPEEVAAMVFFVAGDSAPSINGAIIPIEGARNPMI